MTANLKEMKMALNDGQDIPGLLDPGTFGLPPDAATEALAQMKADFDRQPHVPDPAPAQTSPEKLAAAHHRLEALKATPDWADKLLKGDATARGEFDVLTKTISEGSKADLALLGILPDNYIEVDNAGASLRDQISSIPQLREAGLGDDVIRQVLSDQPVSRAEYRMVQQLQHERMSTREWREKLAAGDFATKRESLLMSVVLASKTIEEN
jgi:hypothetical protein